MSLEKHNKEVISMATPTSPTFGSHSRANSNISIPLTTIDVGESSLMRSRTLPQPKRPSPLRERSCSLEGHQQWSSNWQIQQNLSTSPLSSSTPRAFDPDHQEQALFEQRLCEDIYGVAVRKINHNGKSNLRYVKCHYVDADWLEDGHQSSSKSVSSKHSKGSSLARFWSGGNHHHYLSPTGDCDAHKSLLNETTNYRKQQTPHGKIRVLSWGKKKDVVVPLEKFKAVRKGKVNERTRRNPCESSRILSLVTGESETIDKKKDVVSLDIEAPTKLDRDKFAKAFARFLNVPLIEEGQTKAKPKFAQPSLVLDGSRSVTRSIKSDVTAQSSSWKGDFPNNSYQQIPDIALTGTNSITTAGNSLLSGTNNAPLPVVTTKHLRIPNANKPPRNNTAIRRGTPPPIHPGTLKLQQQQIALNGGGSTTSKTSSDVDDPPLASLASSTGRSSRGVKVNPIKNQATKLVLEIPSATKPKHPANSASNGTPQTPVTATTNGTNHPPPQEMSMEMLSNDEASVVSSITGVGFDQDLVEELHLALEKMKVELEESRAEASRAVKVAEQAIQSAENSNSKDWNNTVTHKAAEAAASAQKKSAEAMAKARIAEERLEVERKNAQDYQKQARDAELLVAHWQTRAAAAEVQRFAMAETFERTKHQPSVAGKKETDRLCSKLAMESARRRKLLDELQDLRGAIRVYCRIKPSHSSCGVLEVVSQEVLMLHRSHPRTIVKNPLLSNGNSPLNFEFDGILPSDMDQQDVYAELEAICTSVLEGFRICVMTFGETNTGKTHTLIGDIIPLEKSSAIENQGVHLRAMKQLFSLMEHRKDRFQDTVTMTLVEVHDERLTDLLAGTGYGEERGKVEGARRSSRKHQQELLTATSEEQNVTTNSISSCRPKLEIKTNRDGETVLRGVLSVDVTSFDDIVRVWKESIFRRNRRLAEQGIKDPRGHERNSHVVASIKLVSRNLSTGAIVTGRMQFVDLASCEVVTTHSSSSRSHKRSLSSNSSASRVAGEWKFTNKSLNALRDVISARKQYQRSVPYRNSTITHILSDSLEGDTKVVAIACVSDREEDVSKTACTLQFAQEMRKVIIGKATMHTSIAPSPNK